MHSPFHGRSVLVTGAGGSIGSEICKRVIDAHARRLTLLSLTEAGLYNVERMLRLRLRDAARGASRSTDETELVPVLGNAGDIGLLNEVLEGVDIVIHAAAHKHVPICEANPIAAIRNNVQATSDLMRASSIAGVQQFCLISSDKAVNPASVMGATKRLAEIMVLEYEGQLSTKFFTVRFGNVLDSAGSVMPLWREQISKGGPITLTDRRCERYFMSIEEAVDLVVKVIGLKPVCGTFVFDMGEPQKLLDIAQRMIAEAGDPHLQIEEIGLRPGEKLTEELHYGGELVPTAIDRVLQVDESNHKRLDLTKFRQLFKALAVRDKETSLQLLWDLVA